MFSKTHFRFRQNFSDLISEKTNGLSGKISKKMENSSGVCKEDEHMELPPGFRFHPTDEELITHYLSPKVVNNRFSARAIGEVDLNKCEPWDLPCKYYSQNHIFLFVSQESCFSFFFFFFF